MALGGMEYIDVVWRHENPDYPVRLVSELNDQRFEIRKLEFFADGTVGFASEDCSARGTELGIVAVPRLDELNAGHSFMGSASMRPLLRSCGGGMHSSNR
jgi:hypothetical protein